MSEFYSMRNMLESQSIANEDKNNQFLASIISMYPCLDIWVRPSNDFDLDVRVVYIQKNPGFVGTDPYVRNNEEPKVWKQYNGTWDQIKSWFIGVLPELSQLHSSKRTGLYVKGGKQPYEGGGMILQENDDGSLGILGRFGVLTVVLDGVEVEFQELAWDFEGCVMEVTVPGPFTIADVTDRPTQNMSGNTSTLDISTPTLSLSYQIGVGGYRRYSGYILNQDPFGFPANVGYAIGTSHGPPTSLSPTVLPNFNGSNTSLPGYVGQPNELMDSFYGNVTFNTTLTQVSDIGGTETYQKVGQAAVGQWTRSHSTYSLNATGYTSTPNDQGLAVLTPYLVDGTWTVTKTQNGLNHDWTWGFVADGPYGLQFQTTSAMNVPGDSLRLATNGSGPVYTQGGPAALNTAQSGSEGAAVTGLTVYYDAYLNSGFVINGDSQAQTTASAGQVGLLLSADSSYGVLSIG